MFYCHHKTEQGGRIQYTTTFKSNN